MLRWLYLEVVTMSIYKVFILCFIFFRHKTSIRQSFFHTKIVFDSILVCFYLVIVT